MQGASVDPSGRLRVVDSAPSSDARFNGGIAFEPDGRMCIVTAGIPPVGDPSVGSFKLKADGRVWVATTGGAPSVWNKAMPFNSVGQLLGVLDTPVPLIAPFNDGIATTNNAIFMTTTPAPPVPTTKFDLTQFPLDSRITFTRSTPGTYWDANGVLKTAAIDEPRPYHKPTGGKQLGLMIEEASANVIRNNTMQGAVAGVIGSGGVVPTGWSGIFAPIGVTREILNVGVEDGIEYMDVRFYGQNTTGAAGTIGIYPQPGTQNPGVLDEFWTGSWFARIIAQPVAPSGVFVAVTERGTAGAYLAQSTVNITPSVDLKSSRIALTRKLSNASVLYCETGVADNVVIGEIVDFTIRVGLPQMEKKAFVTSPIKTSGAAATRQGDDQRVLGTSFSDWFNPVAGTFKAVWMTTTPNVVNGYNAIYAAQNSAGTNSLGLLKNNGNNNQYYALSYVDSVTEAALFTTPILTDAVNEHAFGYMVNDFAASLNGNAATKDTLGALPTGQDRLTIAIGGTSVNGYIASIEYWNTRLPDATLQELTDPGLIKTSFDLTNADLVYLSAGGT